MGILLGCHDASLEYPAVTILDAVTLGVYTGDRIGIVGRNGDGKSTLLRVLSGNAQLDDGSVVRTNSVTVGLLAQHDALADDETAGHAIVGDRPDYEWASEPRIRDVLDALVGDISFDARIGELSGGQRRRVDLARVLIGDYDVIMMDEPTNHLDIQGIHWLAEHVKRRWRSGEGALLVVTHDRWFLDEVCLSMWEVHDGDVTPFQGGYSAYIQQRVERQRQAEASEARRQNILRRELAWLARGAQARSTKPRFRVEAARALIADDPPLRDAIQLRRSAASRLGKKVIHFRHASYAFEHTVVLDALDFNIGAGDRIAILGANGAGKTTFLQLAAGALKPQAGRVDIGQTVKYAVLTQNLDELAAFGDARVREVCSRYKTRYELADGTQRSPLQLLEDLGFSQEQFSCPVCDLSGGQKRRFQLMLVLLDRPNVLILDEPGNDLDTDMLAQLESLLDTWPGTLILVSHDRYLVERVTDNQYALMDGQLIHMPRGVDQYLELVSEHGSAPSAFSLGRTAGASVRTGTSIAIDTGLTQRELRELKKQRSSTERKMGTLRSKLDRERAALLAIDGTDYEALSAQQQRISALECELSALEDVWLELAERLGE